MVPTSPEEDHMFHYKKNQKRKMEERKNKTLQEEKVENEMESIPMIVLTSSTEEDMVNIVIEETSYHSQVFESCVLNEKVEIHVYNKISNYDVSDLFFNMKYIQFQGYYENCDNGEYVDILCV